MEAEMTLVQVDGAGWRCVEVGARFSNALLKVVGHTGLNVHGESSGGSQLVTQSLLVLYK